ncbi:MAG: IS481 family transposase [Theionarchaea archaeon]|nr:IS481 family transposase [Theionarchaea archaeon]
MDVVTERWKLLQLPEEEHLTVTEACNRCGVSRKTYYKWKNRFREEGIDGLKNRSRKPGLSPRKTDAQTESEIVKIKAEFPRWGAYRIRNHLFRKGITLSPKTVNAVLKRHNIPTLWQKRKKIYKRFERKHSNSLWQMDIMGSFPINGVKTYPITVLDDCSRKVLACCLYTKERAKEVVRTLESAVKQYNAPLQIYTDNGGQFLSKKFSAACSRAGITHIKTAIAHPQSIGKIERWHRNLQEEFLDLTPFTSIEEAQLALDKYVYYYNHERSHMGINGATPHARYEERLP